MLLGKKRIILSYAILTLVVVISMAYLLVPPQLKLSYVVDDAYLAEAEPQGTWGNMTCPHCGSGLEGIVIDPDDPQKQDEAWRFAYYCSQEDIFWVYDFPGGISYSRWYGPFNANWRVTNAVATSILIISGFILVLLAIEQLKKSKIPSLLGDSR